MNNTTRPVEQRQLKLNEFKAAYKTLKTGVPWVDHLLLGLLYSIESWIIDERVENEVSEAINEVVLPPMPDMVSPVYTETLSKTSESLPEMRLTAPWYIDGAGERSEP
jgi:hypothetical protein